MTTKLKDSDVFTHTRLELYEMEKEYLSQFLKLENVDVDYLMELRELGLLYSCSGPNSWQMHKMRKPNKSGLGGKEMFRLLSAGRLYCKKVDK